jgi:hypothetical protein
MRHFASIPANSSASIGTTAGTCQTEGEIVEIGGSPSSSTSTRSTACIVSGRSPGSAGVPLARVHRRPRKSSRRNRTWSRWPSMSSTTSARSGEVRVTGGTSA